MIKTLNVLAGFGISMLTLATFSSCHTQKIVKTQAATPVASRTYTKAPGRQAGRPSNSAYNEDVIAYVKLYSPFAIQEMKKYGVPASVIIAQGIHESRAGKSVLATVANNHFGIKCTGDWTGDSFHMDDDRPNECFRKYNNPESSFNDHMLFLQRKRYASLFSLSSTDYKGWAYGLKRCGYATNPRYAEILVSMIERYQLDRFDLGSYGDAPENRATTSEQAGALSRKVPNAVPPVENTGSAVLNSALGKPIQKGSNDFPVGSSAGVREGNTATAVISPGKDHKTFIITDTVHRKVYVTDTVYQYAYQKAIQEARSSELGTKAAQPSKAQNVPAGSTKLPPDSAVHETSSNNDLSAVQTYRVVQGDTLYGICRRLKLDIEQVRTLNQLPDYSIKINQTLKLPPGN